MLPGLGGAPGGASLVSGPFCGTTGLPVTGTADGPCADSLRDGRAGRPITQPDADDSATTASSGRQLRGTAPAYHVRLLAARTGARLSVGRCAAVPRSTSR